MPRIRWIILFVCTLLVFLITGTILFFEAEKIVNLVSMHEERSKQLAETQKRVIEYKEQVEFYGATEGIAHLGREHYNFTYPGEQIFMVSFDKK